jgi:NAD(P) transhydrogenase
VSIEPAAERPHRAPVSQPTHDLIVIGGGPAGQKAAIQAAKAGRRVVVVERDRRIGGACVYQGTIPSKTVRETALALSRLRKRAPQFARQTPVEDVAVPALMHRLESVFQSHATFLADQLLRNGIEVQRGRASFIKPGHIQVHTLHGRAIELSAPFVVIATGSRPRQPPNVPVDHEHILDSDSLLSLAYLPESLVVLGAGVIAAEYASVFQELGVEVTIVDGGPRPVSFMDPELSNGFVHAFEQAGGRYLPHEKIASISFDGISRVVTRLASGVELESEKAVCALGRVANVERLGLERLGIALTKRGHIPVDEHYRTVAPGTYAVGDVVGFPALASTSMEQGRRAALHLLDQPCPTSFNVVPIGIYTIPEMSCVGETECQALQTRGSVRVGRATFDEVSRAHIHGETYGQLKLVADGTTGQLLGIHILGAGAAELLHLGQVAMLSGWTLDQLVETTFNYPTMAECYRVAAFDALNRPLFVAPPEAMEVAAK